MVESLIAGKAVLVNIEDRTHVVNLQQWNVTKSDILHIHDHGGHFIYTITSPLFISKDSLIFIVHDVTKIQPEDTSKTTEVLLQVLHLHPRNRIYIIFTHTDLIHAGQVARNRDLLMGILRQFLDDEIRNLNKLLIEKKSDEANEGFVDATVELLHNFKNKREDLPFFCVSSQNYSGIDDVKDVLVDLVKDKRTFVPKSWVAFYKEIIGTKKIYLTLTEVSQLFPGAPHKVIDISDGATQSEDGPLVPLQYFSDSNLCLHYENNPFLKDYVFPDIDMLADLFKSLFHHNIGEVINYDNDEKLQAKFQEGECDLAVQRYQREGLLGQKLLSYLWEHYGLSLADENVLLKLMKSFNLCYSISKDQEILHFPWFVQSKECPPHIDRNQLMKFDKEHASVHLQCQFFNRIPLNVFEMVSVCLQRRATQDYHYMGDRQAWHDGLEISFGSVQCVLTRSKQNSTIDICLYGQVSDMPQVWQVIESLLKDLQSVLKPWTGVIRNIHFVCGHCVILGKLPRKYWLLDFVFPKEGAKVSQYVKCPKDSAAKVPAALVINIFKGKMLHAVPILY